MDRPEPPSDAERDADAATAFFERLLANRVADHLAAQFTVGYILGLQRNRQPDTRPPWENDLGV